MNDVGHEVGAIRFIVDAPLSSKVAMFNNVANKHQETQLLNPFSDVGGRKSPKPTFSKDEYGKPIAGSLTEMRGQKANLHVCREMLELCQIVNSEGYPFDKKHPELKVILFGELFNIYTSINDKLVGLLLRARKYKLVDFEGEMLFQRRDDEVPIFMLKSIKEIKEILEQRQNEVRRSVSPSPLPTSVLQDLQRRSTSPAPLTLSDAAKINAAVTASSGMNDQKRNSVDGSLLENPKNDQASVEEQPKNESSNSTGEENTENKAQNLDINSNSSYAGANMNEQIESTESKDLVSEIGSVADSVRDIEITVSSAEENLNTNENDNLND